MIAGGVLNLLDAAVERDKGSPLFRRLRFEALLASGKDRDADFWSRLVDAHRVALRDFPDFFDITDRIETEKIFPKMDQDRVGEFLRKRRHRSIRKAGLSTLENVFNKDMDSKLKGDTFALEMQAKVAEKLAGIFAADGDDKKAGKYSGRAKVIGAKSKSERGAMR